jgi:hypothetical protein
MVVSGKPRRGPFGFQSEKKGTIETKEIYEDYYTYVLKHFDYQNFKPLTVVANTNFGMANPAVEYLQKVLPVKFLKIVNNTIDGTFPKGRPDPLVSENRGETIEESQIFAVTDAIQAGLVLSCHDISDGGLATCLAEMSFKKEIGCAVAIPGDVRSDKKLFGETGGFVLEVEGQNVAAVKDIFKKQSVVAQEIGRTTSIKELQIHGVVKIDLAVAKNAWENGLRSKL